VSESITPGNLHQVLQVTFNWGNYHLHEFDFGGERFGIPDPEFDWEPVRSETRIQLKTALGGMASFKYIYDFGDHRGHRIKVEKKLPGGPELSHHAMLLKEEQDRADSCQHHLCMLVIGQPLVVAVETVIDYAGDFPKTTTIGDAVKSVQPPEPHCKTTCRHQVLKKLRMQ